MSKQHPLKNKRDHAEKVVEEAVVKFVLCKNKTKQKVLKY